MINNNNSILQLVSIIEMKRLAAKEHQASGDLQDYDFDDVVMIDYIPNRTTISDHLRRLAGDLIILAERIENEGTVDEDKIAEMSRLKYIHLRFLGGDKKD